jgi:ribulose 1,5-bisphosphate carboxylase large subunit-like protein
MMTVILMVMWRLQGVSQVHIATVATKFANLEKAIRSVTYTTCQKYITHHLRLGQHLVVTR